MKGSLSYDFNTCPYIALTLNVLLDLRKMPHENMEMGENDKKQHFLLSYNVSALLQTNSIVLATFSFCPANVFN